MPIKVASPEQRDDIGALARSESEGGRDIPVVPAGGCVGGPVLPPGHSSLVAWGFHGPDDGLLYEFFRVYGPPQELNGLGPISRIDRRSVLLAHGLPVVRRPGPAAPGLPLAGLPASAQARRPEARLSPVLLAGGHARRASCSAVERRQRTGTHLRAGEARRGAAAQLTPAKTDDGSEYNQGSPTAYRPGQVVTPRTCLGYPHPSSTGRSTDRAPTLESGTENAGAMTHLTSAGSRSCGKRGPGPALSATIQKGHLNDTIFAL